MPSKPMLYKVLVEYEIYVVADDEADAVGALRKAKYDIDPIDYAYAKRVTPGEYIDPDWSDSIPYYGNKCTPEDKDWKPMSVSEYVRLQAKGGSEL